MNLLLDTNIIIFLSKNTKSNLFDTIVNPDSKQIFVSVVSIAELKSIAIQNAWSTNKWQAIDTILEQSVIVEINENLIETYAQIDSFSQRRNALFSKYSFNTPRNMGKNDIWIASTASLLNLKLVTTDSDFDHLHQIFLEIKCIKPEQFLVK